MVKNYNLGGGAQISPREAVRRSHGVEPGLEVARFAATMKCALNQIHAPCVPHRVTTVAQGAEFVSEGFVFAVAGAAVLFEMNRADRIKAADSELKKAKEAVEKAALEARLVSIEEALARVEARTQKSAEESSRRDREAPAGRGWWPPALLR